MEIMMLLQKASSIPFHPEKLSQQTQTNEKKLHKVIQSENAFSRRCRWLAGVVKEERNRRQFAALDCAENCL